MSQKPRKPTTPARVAGNIDGVLEPITAMMSSRLVVLANLLKRGAILRYKRLAGLSSVEFGLVASLGRRPPMGVIRLAEGHGQGADQPSTGGTGQALAGRQGGQSAGKSRYDGLPDQGRAGGA